MGMGGTAAHGNALPQPPGAAILTLRPTTPKPDKSEAGYGGREADGPGRYPVRAPERREHLAYLARVIPTALVGDRFGPLAAGDRGEPVGHRHEPVPRLAASRDDCLVVRPDPQAELVLP